MRAKTIKGITVVIGGETVGLANAIKDVSGECNVLERNLNTVNRALKMDPSSTELLKQKQELLASSIGATKGKLDKLKGLQDQIRQQYQAGDIDQGAYLEFQKEIAATESKLKRLRDQQKEFGTAVQRSMKNAGDGLQEFGGKVSRAGDSLMPISAGLAGAAAGAVMLGSDLEESANKVTVAFGEAAGTVEAFSETSLETYGIAKGTALDMASLFGDMGTSMGLPKQAAADMSTSLVGLAGDLASFKNIGIDEAQTALKGIFTGETESLKNLGIVMTQTNLDAYAMAEGYGKVTKDMTEAEKVQLRYAYVMDKTANAQGDFARTSDGAANSMRVAKESIKEAGASFGQIMLPYVAKAAKKVSELIQKFGKMPEGQKKAVLAIGGIITVAGPLLSMVGRVTTGVGGMMKLFGGGLPKVAKLATGGFKAVGTAMSFLAAHPVVLIIAGITALVGALVYAWKHSEKFRDIVNGAITKVKEVWGKCTEKLTSGVNWVKEKWSAGMSRIKEATGEAMEGAAQYAREKLATMHAAYDAAGGGIKGIVAGAMAGVRSIQEDAFNFLDRLTNGKLSAIRDAFRDKLDAVKDHVRNAIDRIKGFFDFDWSLPKIKMPHSSITGDFGFNPPRIPHVGVEWYAKGGILSGATIFGALGNRLLGGGEAGQEAVLPLNSFYEHLGQLLRAALADHGQGGVQVAVAIDRFENHTNQDLDELCDYVEDRIQTKIDREGAVFA